MIPDAQTELFPGEVDLGIATGNGVGADQELVSRALSTGPFLARQSVYAQSMP